MVARDEGGGKVEDDGQPYSWDDEPLPSAEALQLWVEVGNGLDKNQTGEYDEARYAAGRFCSGFPQQRSSNPLVSH